MKKIYLDYIEDIINSTSEVEIFVKNMSFEKFIMDRKTTNAVIRSFEVMGEAAKNISEAIKQKYPHIPWKKLQV